jgi:hypothetical protein
LIIGSFIAIGIMLAQQPVSYFKILPLRLIEQLFCQMVQLGHNMLNWAGTSSGALFELWNFSGAP